MIILLIIISLYIIINLYLNKIIVLIYKRKLKNKCDIKNEILSV